MRLVSEGDLVWFGLATFAAGFVLGLLVRGWLRKVDRPAPPGVDR